MNNLNQMNYGENLYGWNGPLNWASAVNAWTSEVNFYDFTKGGFSQSTGHFTQVCTVPQGLEGLGN